MLSPADDYRMYYYLQQFTEGVSTYVYGLNLAAAATYCLHDITLVTRPFVHAPTMYNYEDVRCIDAE